MAADEAEIGDLIIIKRRLNTDLEQPKGGVWKIAFADFMTAMMCFFLVMWLINSANEDTRKAVASYFNPVRLAELNRKGIQNPHISEDQTDSGPRSTQEEETKPSKPSSPASAQPSPERSDEMSREALFSDPYKVLAELAKQAKPPSDGHAGAGGGSEAAGEEPPAGGVFRDLFDPEFRQSLGEAAKAEGEAESTKATQAAAPAEQLQSTPVSVRPEIEPSAALAIASPADVPKPAVTMPALRPSEPVTALQEADRSELAAALSEAVEKETTAGRRPGVEVEQTGEGVMISLTDDADFGMFDIGSAEPQPQMVRIMERIAEILKARGGAITIRGHTDARPFRGGNYDNWRLSTDRAQMAYYMLVRGGLDEKRVEAIEGYADRKLKQPADPEAAPNRRIEILLREASS